MFTQTWGMASKKRNRDEDGDGDVAIGGTEGFTEHRNKRLQSLPFRTSPPSKRLSFPSSFNSGALSNSNLFGAPQRSPHTITPGDSDSEDVNTVHLHQKTAFTGQAFASPSLAVVRPVDAAPFDHAPEMVDGYRTADVDMDMDMDGPQNEMQTQSPVYLGPGPSQPDPMQPGSITSRMPTPIHCSFAAQVRGNNWSGAAGNMMQASPFSQPPPDRSIPRSLDRNAMVDWDLVQNRRLPSPISESGGEELVSPRMVLDSQAHPGMPPRAASAMDFSAPARTPSALSTVSDVTGSSSSGSSHSGNTTSIDCDVSAHAMDIEPAVAPSPKKGHTRSRHTLNGWTQDVPGMKKTFSIGYRADCEKCRQKVPGHFNHIIVS
ncbi:hypothetical protein M406DRAFT_347953 [Cryphonectria parasitica EP155]|uniref:Uncharacterized protein n=1 Tax=Cryphonectria parasitica (strain ATCC 38755 / EP155) TaxID=660469 RepID=A0A9P4XVA7_CRYP1|nr:uncharacterized protein M406DRAFT_347953 [Cryphonectria parasitica EP155]KAF3761653.1 hypothetical protein M406DRAFT_347953 [Cryphonectria parasitica EP155]